MVLYIFTLVCAFSSLSYASCSNGDAQRDISPRRAPSPVRAPSPAPRSWSPPRPNEPISPRK